MTKIKAWLVFQDAPNQTSAVPLSKEWLDRDWSGVGPWAIVFASTLGEASNKAKLLWIDDEGGAR